MDIVLNLQPIYDFFSLPIDIMAWKFFLTIGWMPITFVFLWGGSSVFLEFRRDMWASKQKFIFLAIDVPKGNMQSPKAVENVFAYLAGVHGTYDLYETWWLGEFQLALSLEIVSLEGYIQFLIRTPERFRDLVESAIYSQYPDAEITEINDYIEPVADLKFPNDQYDLYGGEFKFVKNNVYPIKTYLDFEHDFGEPEEKYKDPMAALMDLMSSLKKGEQLWYQIILVAITDDWAEKAEDEVRKIIGEKPKASDKASDKIIEKLLFWIDRFSETVYSLWGDIEEKKKEEKEPQFRMMNLKPKQKRQVEKIHEKVGKLAFEFKIRFIYLAKKEVFNKSKAANGFIGYMKQFNYIDLNAFKPDVGNLGTATKVNYPIFKEQRLNTRKNKIFKFFKRRHRTAGRTRMVMNIEELATIWHFPVESVSKPPLISKAPGRKAEAPASLPVGEEDVSGFITRASGNGQAVRGEVFKQEIENNVTKSENTESTPNKGQIFKQEVESMSAQTQNLKTTEAKGQAPKNLPFA